MDRKEQNIRVFFDTEDWCRSTEKLRRWIRKAKDGTKLYIWDKESAPMPPVSAGLDLPARVTQERTFEAAIRLRRENPEKRICVLNFASATNPGGGVRRGSSAQEESLCRCSTLYPCLTDRALYDSFYQYHRSRKDEEYTDSCIYTPDVIICKSDTASPERLPQEDWVHVDVISCAAPNLRNIAAPPRDHLLQVHRSRARRVLSVAKENRADILVAGAFGCGAFRNDPTLVSQAWKEALEEHREDFSLVLFAVYCPGPDKSNYEAFAQCLGSE